MRPLSFLAVMGVALAMAPEPSPAASEDPAEPRPLDVDVPGTERSKVPTAAEWRSATPVKLSRTSPAGAACRATRVREWLRVRCPSPTFAVSLLGGSNSDLAFWIAPKEENEAGEVQFPMVRGDRRVVQFWMASKDADGTVVPKPSMVLQEQWVDGEPAPTISVL